MSRNIFEDVPTGARLFRNTGELSFETRPRQAGTFRVVFLEPVEDTMSKVINQHGRLEVVHNTLLSNFRI